MASWVYERAWCVRQCITFDGYAAPQPPALTSAGRDSFRKRDLLISSIYVISAGGGRLTEATEFARLVGQRDDGDAAGGDADAAGGHMDVDSTAEPAPTPPTRCISALSMLLLSLSYSPLLYSAHASGGPTWAAQLLGPPVACSYCPDGCRQQCWGVLLT